MRRLMGRGDVVILLWGSLLFVLWVVAWALWHPDVETVVMLAVAVGATVAKAAWATIRGLQRPEPSDDEPLAVVTTTHATSLLGVAICGVALAFEFGPWLMYLSGGLLLIAIAGLIREHRATRAGLREVAEREQRA
ncbi:MAG TPA: hypothetical protein VFT50_17930 [Baekduia sp.]|nr:hypothetical protein [Baekduia sp.]